ncbi:hypothetical protein [Pseudidiomarina andamanensis]|nr:hypothetical protein [Pseudidiomarina andamanensis]MDS0219684.1 hypothetical protein [Pseudidiomarina andamanensis]
MMKSLSLVTNVMNERGYVSVLILPAVAGLLLVLLLIVTQQQRLQQRWHLQSAADNMALSAATIIAREFNLLAIINRALIANQVTQGQLLGLASWYSNLSSASDRLALVSSVIPYVNIITRQLANAVAQVEQPLNLVLTSALTMQRVLFSTLQTAQWMIRASFAMMIPQSLTEVAQAQNIKQQTWTLLHSPGLVEFPWLWWRYLPIQHASRDNDLLLDMTQSSRDPFSKNRSYKWFDAGVIKAQKAGGSELITVKNGRWAWQAMDTVALHIRLLFKREEIPWGEGATYQTGSIDQVTESQFGESSRLNPRATQLGLLNQKRMGVTDTPSYFNQEHLAPDDWPSVIIKFNDVIAKAGVRFSRPKTVIPRRDKRIEHANLFNALWEPELQSLSTTEKFILSRFSWDNL